MSVNSENNAKVLAKFTAAAMNRDKTITRAQYTVLLVKDLRPSEENVRVRFADPTGEISGTIHKKVVEEYVDDLKVGSVLIMKKVCLSCSFYFLYFLFSFGTHGCFFFFFFVLLL